MTYPCLTEWYSEFSRLVFTQHAQIDIIPILFLLVNEIEDLYLPFKIDYRGRSRNA